MNKNTIKIGTRGSKLALAQANIVKSMLEEKHEDLKAEIIAITTTGDRIQDRSLIEAGGKGLFTKEIEDALRAGEIDLAVHSMKDVPAVLPKGFEISCVLPREEPWDAFISEKYDNLWDLPEGALLGTSGVRRKALALAARPDLKVEVFRGNVDTRLNKIARGDVDASFLAVAGLNRLGLEDKITCKLSADEMLPAAGQGAVGIEVRTEDNNLKELLSVINCTETATCVAAERGFIKELDGSCRTPIAAYACYHNDNTIHMRVLAARLDGSEIWHDEQYGEIEKGDMKSATDLGRQMGIGVRADIPDDFLKEIIK